MNIGSSTVSGIRPVIRPQNGWSLKRFGGYSPRRFR